MIKKTEKQIKPKIRKLCRELLYCSDQYNESLKLMVARVAMDKLSKDIAQAFVNAKIVNITAQNACLSIAAKGQVLTVQDFLIRLHFGGVL